MTTPVPPATGEPITIPLWPIVVHGITPPRIPTIQYRDPDGQIWDLSDASLDKGYVCTAIAGIEGIPVMMQTIPMLDGTAIPTIYIPQTGTIGLAVLITRPASNSQDDYYKLLDAFARAFLNRRKENPAPGYIIITRPDRPARQIAVYCISGLNTPEVGLNDTTLYSLALATPDPYWSDVTQTSFPLIAPNNKGILPVGPFPATPIVLDPAAVFGKTSVFNPSTGLIYPDWWITGPGTPIMKNLSSGRQWSLTAPIPAGDVVHAVTQRGKQMIVDTTSGQNLWPHLVTVGPHDLWPLLGNTNNNLSIEMTGSTPQT